VAEIQQALGADANEVQQMIAEVDSDGDGQVDFDEFITLWSMRSENDSAAAAAAAKKA
jgi:Ca2+-binding EF-hand superfamily protein